MWEKLQPLGKSQHIQEVLEAGKTVINIAYGMNCTTKGEIKVNYRYHVEVMQLVCTGCEGSFIQMWSFKTFQKILGSTEVIYMYQNVGKSLVLRKFLKWTRKSHTGSKQFPCAERKQSHIWFFLIWKENLKNTRDFPCNSKNWCK